jgi:hypothetical protein
MCLPCAIPSTGTVVTVGTMAKDETASKRLIRPKTPEGYLARLRQFEPRPSPFGAPMKNRKREICTSGNLQEQCPFGENQEPREKRIDDVLSAFMDRYIHDAMKLKLFLEDAKRAIAAYIGARETGYDRWEARKLLSETSIALETARRKLQEIARWPELSNYVKYVFRGATPTERPEPSSQEQVKQELQRIDDLYSDLAPDQIALHRLSQLETVVKLQRIDDLDRSYSDLAPDQIALRLSQLETVVSLAAERVTFGPGDAQRDQIAQDFTDQLASAWLQATETLPTCSRRTLRLKNRSPFARLLETINQELLEERHRSPNAFFEYGAKAVKAVKRLRQLIGP